MYLFPSTFSAATLISASPSSPSSSRILPQGIIYRKYAHAIAPLLPELIPFVPPDGQYRIRQQNNQNTGCSSSSSTCISAITSHPFLFGICRYSLFSRSFSTIFSHSFSYVKKYLRNHSHGIIIRLTNMSFLFLISRFWRMTEIVWQSALADLQRNYLQWHMEDKAYEFINP